MHADRMDGFDLIVEDERWTQLDTLAQEAIVAALAHLDLDASQYEVVILACGDARISALNADFRGKPQPTNVLSWPSTDLAPGETPEPELGDIAIAYETCQREAGEQGKPFDAHVTHLLVHATLHLLGYDHQNDADALQMERLEVEILGNLGLSDPY